MRTDLLKGDTKVSSGMLGVATEEKSKVVLFIPGVARPRGVLRGDLLALLPADLGVEGTFAGVLAGVLALAGLFAGVLAFPGLFAGVLAFAGLFVGV